MRPLRVSVTAVGGFTDYLLVERLAFSEGVLVLAMAHRPAGAISLARLPVESELGDLNDRSALARALEGSGAEGRCLYGANCVRAATRCGTVDGTRMAAEAAETAGGARFIHVSPLAVHSHSPPPVDTNSITFTRSGGAYCDDELGAEQAALGVASTRALPTVILRTGSILGAVLVCVVDPAAASHSDWYVLAR